MDAGCQCRIVSLHTPNVVLDEHGTPALMGFMAIRQKLEMPLNNPREAIGLSDG